MFIVREGRVLTPMHPCCPSLHFNPMIGENRRLVADEPVEFEKSLVELWDCRRITDDFRGIYRIYLKSIKENRRMPTCNRLDLQTLGSQPIIMPKKSPWSLLQSNLLRVVSFRSTRIHVMTHATKVWCSTSYHILLVDAGNRISMELYYDRSQLEVFNNV